MINLDLSFRLFQDIDAITRDRMEHSGYPMDFRAEHRMQPRIIFYYGRGGPGVFRLDPNRSQYLRPRSSVRPNWFSGEETARELCGTWQSLAYLAKEIQIPVVDA